MKSDSSKTITWAAGEDEIGKKMTSEFVETNEEGEVGKPANHKFSTNLSEFKLPTKEQLPAQR